MKKKMFIASSKEGKPVLDELHFALGEDLVVTPWTISFNPGEHAMEALLRQLDMNDLGAYVLTPDDEVKSRGQETHKARDNVIFEMGLAIGRYGRKRAFIIHEASISVPTDLYGITAFRFDGSKDLKLEMSRVAAGIRSFVRSQDFSRGEARKRARQSYISFIKVNPGQQGPVLSGIHRMSEESDDKGYDVTVDQAGVLFGEWDDFVVFTASDVEAATLYVRDLRHEFGSDIQSVDTRLIFPKGFWRREGTRSDLRENYLVLLSCTPSYVETTFDALVKLANKDVPSQRFQVDDIAILFGRHDIFFTVSSKKRGTSGSRRGEAAGSSQHAFYQFLHENLGKSLLTNWFRENTTSLEFVYHSAIAEYS